MKNSLKLKRFRIFVFIILKIIKVKGSGAPHLQWPYCKCIYHISNQIKKIIHKQIVGVIVYNKR